MSFAAKGVAADEIAKFRKLQQHWWDPTGPLRSLHLFNPIRARFVNSTVQHYGKKVSGSGGLDFLSSTGLTPAHTVLDVGCGGGILSESLARLGGTVLGIDACDESIAVASQRQRQMLENAATVYSAEALKGLWQSRLSFASTSLFDVVEQGKQFDVVVASEVIEHVSDARAFLQGLCDATAPGGLLILSTMDKTVCTAFSHILIAENLTGIVEPGTHDWSKFIPPKDMTSFAARFGVRNVDLQYVVTYPDLFQSVASKNFQVNFTLSRSFNTGHYFWAGLKAASSASRAASAGKSADADPATRPIQ